MWDCIHECTYRTLRQYLGMGSCQIQTLFDCNLAFLEPDVFSCGMRRPLNAITNRRLKKSAIVVLAPLEAPRAEQSTPSPLRLLRPWQTAYLSILRWDFLLSQAWRPLKFCYTKRYSCSLLKMRNRPFTKPWERNAPGVFSLRPCRNSLPALRLRNIAESHHQSYRDPQAWIP